MSNTEKRNDEIIAETMQEFYDSIEASRRMKEQQKKEDELAALQAELDEDEVVNQYDYIYKELIKRGYNQYEVSNYCKEGYKSKHNLVYWKDKQYWNKQEKIKKDGLKLFAEYFQDLWW